MILTIFLLFLFFHRTQKTPTARKVHFKESTTAGDPNSMGASFAAPPASVTPGPNSATKPPVSTNGTYGLATGAGGGREEMNTIDPVPMDISPAKDLNSMESFGSNYTEFQNIIQELKDIHERGDSAILSMNVLLATAYAETLQDQGDLSMFLASLSQLNIDMDDQIAEYEEFVGSFAEP